MCYQMPFYCFITFNTNSQDRTRKPCVFSDIPCKTKSLEIGLLFDMGFVFFKFFTLSGIGTEKNTAKMLANYYATEHIGINSS